VTYAISSGRTVLKYEFGKEEHVDKENDIVLYEP